MFLSLLLSHPAVASGRAVLIKACIQEESVSKKIRFGPFITFNSVCIIIVKQEEITCQVFFQAAVTEMCASWKCTKGSSGFAKIRISILFKV